MLVDKQSELMSDLLFTVHQHCGDDVTRKPPIATQSRRLVEMAKIDPVSPFYLTLWLKIATLQWENLQEVQKTSLKDWNI